MQGFDLRVPKNKENNEPQPPWLAFAILFGSAVAVIVFYGCSVGSFSLLLIELLIGGASLSAGGGLGFLFGMPRTMIGSATTDENHADNLVTYRPGTNLDQISYWLTKILIGVGLVELKQVGVMLATAGRVVAHSINNPPDGTEVTIQVIIIIFLVSGFIASFLWTRIYYGPLQTLIDSNLVEYLKNSVKELSTAVHNQVADTQEVKDIAGKICCRQASNTIFPGRSGTTSTKYKSFN